MSASQHFCRLCNECPRNLGHAMFLYKLLFSTSSKSNLHQKWLNVLKRKPNTTSNARDFHSVRSLSRLQTLLNKVDRSSWKRTESDRFKCPVDVQPCGMFTSIRSTTSQISETEMVNVHHTSDGVEDKAQKTNSSLQGQDHVPVMVVEVLNLLQPKDNQILIDMTFGAGGHAKEIISVARGIRYIGVDRDPYAFSLAQELSQENSQVTPILSKFSELSSHLQTFGIQPGTVDAFLFDLGASSMQFDTALRGFSLVQNGPLDMRMDGNIDPDSVTAADILNTLDPHDLTHILKKYGEENRAREIAHAIVESRYAFGNFTTTQQLAEVVKAVFGSTAFKHDKLYRQSHVATKTFQALRIFVNDELNEVHNGLEIARHYLRPGGRCAVIAFHSLEDRIVKRHFHDIDIDEVSNMTIHQHFRNANVTFDVDDIKEKYLTKPWEPLSRKVMEASADEVYRNPRARSAKLRIAIKL